MNDGYEYNEQVGAGAAGMPVLVYLATRYTHSTRDDWSSRLAAGQVLLDGRPAGAADRLEAGQILTWRRPPWTEPDAPVSYRVVFGDEHLLAVSKPAGLPTVPGGGFLDRTLLARVREDRPGASPLHRLGRFTSGLVLFALTREARSSLAAAWRRGEVRRHYRAIAAGEPSRDVFLIEDPIGPVPHPVLGSVHAVSPEGKAALTRVEVLERRGREFLAGIEIRTGRPHQIRIHLAAAGHPLVGDPLYAPGGGLLPGTRALPGDPGYRLHAERLVFRHPRGGDEVEIVDPPPAGLV